MCCLPSIGRGWGLDGVADFAEPVSWNDEDQLFRLHAVFRV